MIYGSSFFNVGNFPNKDAHLVGRGECVLTFLVKIAIL